MTPAWPGEVVAHGIWTCSKNGVAEAESWEGDRGGATGDGGSGVEVLEIGDRGAGDASGFVPACNGSKGEGAAP